MKTSHDPRHLERINVVKGLFAWDFNHEAKIENKTVQEIVNNIESIDNWIQEAAPSWPIDKINRIDLAIMRLASYELMILKDNPPKVIVDEAIEIGKEFGGESSPTFINGALGKLISNNNISTT